MNELDMPLNRPIVVIVDDDYEDVYPMRRAILNCREGIVCDSVSSGEELFEYLNCTGRHQNRAFKHAPRVILIDINMPRKNGFEVLKELRSDSDFGCISVIMFTTSDSEGDIRKAYKAGANSYIRKPSNANDLKDIAVKMCDYWINLPQVLSVV